MLYFIGDRHGDIFHDPLPAKQENDVQFFLGDIGVPWGVRKPGYNPSEDKRQLSELSSTPGTHILILGNHDDYNWADSLQEVDLYGGKAKQASLDGKIFPNVFVIDKISIFHIDGKDILCIAKAESHDIADGILDPNSMTFEEDKSWLLGTFHWNFRVKDWTWWPQEKMNVPEARRFLEENDAANTHFSYILSHDCPSLYVQNIARFIPTPQEDLLDEIRRTFTFDYWMHGHMHTDYCYGEEDDEQIYCLYKFIRKEGGEIA